MLLALEFVSLNRSIHLRTVTSFTRIMLWSGLKWFRSNRFLECRLLFCLEDAQMLLLFKATVIKDERQKSEKRDLFFFWSAVRGGAGGAGGPVSSTSLFPAFQLPQIGGKVSVYLLHAGDSATDTHKFDSCSDVLRELLCCFALAHST